jgi:hypothetical protein
VGVKINYRILDGKYHKSKEHLLLLNYALTNYPVLVGRDEDSDPNSFIINRQQPVSIQ